ncbi:MULTISPECIES: hypothetical protein [Kitasatospora]|uniref:Glycosyltransferase RgtA/B/C/D-like domain-containing protein n=1 Tax=Kitasatospora setae (strain ATCC 33774 / DSM 43861 / JCM 3304 / KCC A-0304 / NBRC 14216 / KM-6054) TaxID=452652 RepID=E4NCP9_KITSK|nr:MULTISPECIES: hypothetical protein [Kitasatospora]BAJ28980.1 hypothetical protein KSE_31700 [Kitasatospora setae KM-6054]
MQPVTEELDAPRGNDRSGSGERSGARFDRVLLAARTRGAALVARPRFWTLAVLVGYLLQVGYRLALSLHHSYPTIHADEASYLVIGRVLAGQPVTEMPVGVVIPGGYPLLLVPAFLLGKDPSSVYHLVMATNSVVNALVFPLAYLALRRLAIGRPLALVTAMTAAFMPPVVYYAEYAMSEAVFPVILLAWLICMHGWLTPGGSARRRMLFAAGMGLSAAYAMATHDRGGVVVALTGLVLVVVLAFGWVPRAAGAVGLGALAVGVLAGKLMAAWLESQFKDSPASSVGGQVFKNLLNDHLLSRTVKRMVGQWWYFAISSWGFAAVAIVVCCAAIVSRRFALADRVVSFCAVALVAGISLASAAGLPTDDRIDNWIYARYLAPLVPVFFVIGVAVLYRSRLRQVAGLYLAGALFTVLTCAFIVRLVGKALYKLAIIPWAMPDSLLLASEWSKLHMVRTTAAALIVLGFFVLLRMAGGRRVVWALTSALCAFALYATTTLDENIVDNSFTYNGYMATGFTKDAGLKPGDNLVMEWDVEWGIRMAQTYEVYPGRVWTRSLSYGDPIPEQANVALVPAAADGDPAKSWPKAPAGWKVDKVNKLHGWVLWRKG